MSVTLVVVGYVLVADAHHIDFRYMVIVKWVGYNRISTSRTSMCCLDVTAAAGIGMEIEVEVEDSQLLSFPPGAIDELITSNMQHGIRMGPVACMATVH